LAEVILAVVLGGAVEVGADVNPLAAAVLLDVAATVPKAAPSITKDGD